ncbi:hypothetical protein V3C99_017270 [Haemonchus contortus]|uniref:Uncharacterized protein n=1 Tax=Haemonchus contortus TaxID=6289 RepID=A0A7I5EEZ0_HAECO|nr:Gex interacting protein protein 10, isoform a [Haemonchus contortus]
MADPEDEKEDQAGQSAMPNGATAASSSTVLTLPPKVDKSPSSALIEESMRLLDLKSSVPPTYTPPEPLVTSRPLYDSMDYGSTSDFSTTRFPKATPRFKRIDFDDRLEHLCDDNKPSWKLWQESVKESYHKAKRSVERSKDETQFLESTLSRTRKSRGESPFRNLDTETGFIPSVRSQSSLFTPSLADRSVLASTSSTGRSYAAGSGPYAAPALSFSQGIESRYEQRANDVEAMLLKTAPLPTRMKITAKEFRNAPNPSAGSASEHDDYDFSMYCPKPYYSRPNRDDPDYFDFDLQHSVDLFKRPEGKYTPRGPQEWEKKLLGEVSAKGSTPVSGYMFTKGDSDWRTNGSSYLSAALRTPKFWEQRFESLGKQVRDSNPISLDSINRNRPTPSRFTEYIDPDFEDYDDPRSAD